MRTHRAPVTSLHAMTARRKSQRIQAAPAAATATPDDELDSKGSVMQRRQRSNDSDGEAANQKKRPRHSGGGVGHGTGRRGARNKDILNAQLRENVRDSVLLALVPRLCNVLFLAVLSYQPQCNIKDRRTHPPVFSKNCW